MVAGVEAIDAFDSILDYRTGEPLARVGMARVPTPSSWEVPAHLRFGNGNDCPEPAVHVAVWRRWQQTFGAEVVAVTADVIEARVGRPPTTRAAARERCPPLRSVSLPRSGRPEGALLDRVKSAPAGRPLFRKEMANVGNSAGEAGV